MNCLTCGGIFTDACPRYPSCVPAATDTHIQLVATLTAKETVRETLQGLGIDVSTPEAIIAAQRDFAHLRSSREGLEAVRRGFLMTGVVTIATGIGTAIWYALSAAKALGGK